MKEITRADCKSTYDRWKEASGAERSERKRHSESSEEENDGQQEDVGDGAGDVVVEARLACHAPAALFAQLLRDTLPAHFNGSVGVVSTIRVQFAHPAVSVRVIDITLRDQVESISEECYNNIIYNPIIMACLIYLHCLR